MRHFIGKNCTVQDNVLLGVVPAGISPKEVEPTVVGDNALLRTGTIIYCSVKIGSRFQSGHNVLIREETEIGDNVLIGTNSVIEGQTRIGSGVSIQSSVYIPRNTLIEDGVFIGPCAVLTNDKYPLRIRGELKGPVLRRSVSVGANSTILPGIEIGEGVMVGAGCVVTKSIPPWKLALGNPMEIRDLPKKLRIFNKGLR